MNYRVTYLKPKKKKGFYVKESVVLGDIESAIYYEEEMSKRGSKDFQITPVQNMTQTAIRIKDSKVYQKDNAWWSIVTYSDGGYDVFGPFQSKRDAECLNFQTFYKSYLPS